jgi:hypothetical protein
MLSINQRFDKHYICHFEGECVVGWVLEALYRTGNGCRGRFDGAEW